MDAVEAVARALYVAKGAHNVFGPWEAQLYQSLKEPFRRQAKALVEPIVADALSAARPFIAAECAKVAEDYGPVQIPLRRQENYSGEHREWSENITLPKGMALFKDIAAAIKETIR